MTNPAGTVATENNDDVIAAMQGMLHRAPEPAGLTPGEASNSATANEDVPVNMIASTISSAGYVYVWDRRTGERSTINMNMLPAQLKKRHPDGGLVFQHFKPDIEPQRGTLKCLLHKESPGRAAYDLWGLAYCTKSNLPSPYMVEQHMAHRHKNEWATIQRQRAEEEKRGERERTEQHQRDLVAAVAGRLPVDEESQTLAARRGRRAVTTAE